MHTYLLDTNVLLDDPNAISSFGDNDIILPLVVVEEMDRFKDRPGELGANAREFSRYLGSFISDGVTDLSKGVKTAQGGQLRVVTLSDLASTQDDLEKVYPELSDYKGGDNRILQVLFKLTKQASKAGHEPPVLVTRDIQLRVKCNVLGLRSEDRKKGGSKRKARELYKGYRDITLPWDDVTKIYSGGNGDAGPVDICALVQSVEGDEHVPLSPHEVVNLFTPDGSRVAHNATYRNKNGNAKLVYPVTVPKIHKLSPRNSEQKAALDLLLDPSVKLVTIMGKAGTGKAQSLDSKVLTPAGWSTMGQLGVGDLVIGGDGKPTKITGVFPQGVKEMYRITFSDGSSTKCCDDHLWYTQTSLERNARRSGKVRSLRELRTTLTYGSSKKRNHMIPMVLPVEFERKEVSIEPYFFGVLLGDGSFRGGTPTLSTSDNEILENCLPGAKACGVRFNKHKTSKYDYYISNSNKKGGTENQLSKHIRNMGLRNKFSFEKSIPNEYKFNSPDVRLAVLQGLMDTDGFVSKDGTSTVFYSSSEQLAKDVQELVWSFGGKAVLCNKQTSYTDKTKRLKSGRPSFAVHISLDNGIVPFRLERKVSRFVPRTKYKPSRYVKSIESIGFEEAQCISVDNEEHLYVTDDYIVTHNTLIALAAGLEMVLEQKQYKTLFVCRPIQPVGRDIGYLPGAKDEKLSPWLAPIKDNLKYLLSTHEKSQLDKLNNNNVKKKQNRYGDDGNQLYGSHEKKLAGESMSTFDYLIERGIIEIEAMTYIRGRSIANAFMLIDESQNMSEHELKTILTRVGENTKIVLTGDVEQIDALHLDSVSNGLAVCVEKFRDVELAGHLTLQKGVRSELATISSEILG